MSQGPPPVPGGRSPEEREAARRERDARRAARTGKAPPAQPPPHATDDWLAEAQRLTEPPPNGHRPTPQADRRHWGRLVAALVAAALFIGAGWFLVSLFQPFHGDGEGDVRVVVPRGSSLGDIADLLERKGVISNAGFFELRARLAGRSGDLKPGPYTLRGDMSFVAALDALERGVPPNIVVVTIPEGRSRREIAPLVKRLDGNYVRQTRRSPELDPRDYGAEGARSLEGFLFPATYELKKGQPVRRLVQRQLAAFRQNFDRVDLGFAKRKNLTPYDVLIIASMVEREAQVARERRLIASVIYNRLRQGTPRATAGLPPGPIGNPGLASIRAAANPARTRHLFYVVKPGTCGEHAFSSTDADFQEDVARYNVARERRGGRSPTDC